MMKKLIISFFLLLSSLSIIAQDNKSDIALSGNAYVTSPVKEARITERGLENWKNPATVISVYFYTPEAGTIDLTLKAKGESQVKVTYKKSKFMVKISSEEFTEIPVGKIDVAKPGYVKIDIQGVEKNGDFFGQISDLIVGHTAEKLAFVKDFSTHFGRRGPSVHLNYTMPKEQTEWFYNEVTVPESGEIQASYYMANGFGEGYFGMQFNSPTERRILFSVWSPFNTQNPNDIPEEDRIKMLRRGEDVHIGEFGNEGSGGQSFLRYNWKAGVTYPFLMQVRPDGKGNTVYTAYFYATDENRWRLIASFLRPKTDTWYKNAHSFLENFSPEQGYLERWVMFNNQWTRGTDGVWREITEAKFSHDATAGAGVRKDYQGGMKGKKGFYLKNGGFFNEFTTYGVKFDRPSSSKHPEIDFEALEKL